MKQLARIIKNCGTRGKVGSVYEIVEKNPKDGFRLVVPGETTYTFWYPADCCEETSPGACTIPNWDVPENADFAWHLDKVTESVTDLLKEKNKAYGNSALNPAHIFSKLDAVESLLVRMDDKIMRIKNKGINDETEDTVTDLIGYLLLLKMAMERKK
jgi:hypothetical protein